MLVEGLIIVMDLDRFEEFIEEKGLSQWSPNIVTGTLTLLVEEFVRKWQAIVVYGLDPKRGTEEVVLEIPFGHEFIDEITKDLSRIKEEINKLGASISIVVVKDFVMAKPANNRREAYYGSPGRKRAIRFLKKIKRRGGNRLEIIL